MCSTVRWQNTSVFTAPRSFSLSFAARPRPCFVSGTPLAGSRHAPYLLQAAQKRPTLLAATTRTKPGRRGSTRLPDVRSGTAPRPVGVHAGSSCSAETHTLYSAPAPAPAPVRREAEYRPTRLHAARTRDRAASVRRRSEGVRLGGCPAAAMRVRPRADGGKSPSYLPYVSHSISTAYDCRLTTTTGRETGMSCSRTRCNESSKGGARIEHA